MSLAGYNYEFRAEVGNVRVKVQDDDEIRFFPPWNKKGYRLTTEYFPTEEEKDERESQRLSTYFSDNYVKNTVLFDTRNQALQAAMEYLKLRKQDVPHFLKEEIDLVTTEIV